MKWTAQSPIAHAFHPPQALNIPPYFRRHKQGRHSVSRPIRRTQRSLQQLIVIWLTSRFGQGIKPPRRPNFALNMHPNKRCRRSLARPNRTTPEYHDANHGVAVGRPQWFRVIAPIAFVGGMGGWCCRTWCAVVLAVVLRSCAGYFLFHVNKVHQ